MQYVVDLRVKKHPNLEPLKTSKKLYLMSVFLSQVKPLKPSPAFPLLCILFVLRSFDVEVEVGFL